ncbi:MAG: S9 family peptidase [Bacteroidetes bacterium HGW-Bacteroidetes-1]|jgi:dipeptidyl aminopeptidase/acylaminoacyl peptidase|nr:MAG: S9 family peptidase [Bacteroidetes bacterium HGW-Bacteroidetes-1]
MKTKKFLLTSIFFALFIHLFSQEEFTYQLPPKEVIEIVDAPATPSVSIGSKAGKILVIENSELPSLEELSAEELRLAGIRINPATNGMSRASFSIGLSMMDLDGKNIQPVVGLPKKPRIRNIEWSPDEKHIAFTHTSDRGIEIWILDVSTRNARKLTSMYANEALGNGLAWLSDNKTLLFKGVPEGRGERPVMNLVVNGPVVQESYGRKAAVRTFQDLLKDSKDELLFDYYATSQIFRVSLEGSAKPVGEPGVIGNFTPSPDGKYLLVNKYIKPYSYIVPYYRFPQTYEITDLEGNSVRLLAEVPVADNLPQGFDAVAKGMRSPSWQSDVASTLFWVEAIDGGDPAAKAIYRDQIFLLKAPFDGEPIPSIKLRLRYGGFIWGKNDFALISEYWRKDRNTRTYLFDPSLPDREPVLLFERSTEDRYNDPGRFQTITNSFGFNVLQFDKYGKKLFLFGQGASPEGNRPFVDVYEIITGKTTRLWRSEAPWFESPVKIMDVDKMELITRRESIEVQPNYYSRLLKSKKIKQLTFFPDPMPQLKGIQKEMINYDRADGIPLSGTLYLPKGFTPGQDAPLPTLLWAYPNEYKSADAAGQVSGSPYSFTRISASSPIILVTQGYAVFYNASFPIIGEGNKEPNDSFIQQLVANAEAAINKLVEMGVSDRDMFAASGHSYGAFMTANLLTHCDLFAAGIARSGAYNRTLTPFGFQGEERTYWQTPEVYNVMSPFMQAEKMKTPLLLLHGLVDNNSGTFPMQTERYFDALRGLGATARMVLLPNESHGYRARESVLHMHWETIQWLDKYLKGK